jgi:hypothetical protein
MNKEIVHASFFSNMVYYQIIISLQATSIS